MRLKRGQIEGNISIEDPVGWLSTAALRALDRQVRLNFIEVLDHPMAISCLDESSGAAVLFSLLSPKELRTLSREKRSELSKRGAQHPLLPWRKDIDPIEMNILNAGIRFDLELPVVWQGMAKEKTAGEKLWGYVFPS